MKKEIIFEHELNHDIEKVWSAITEQEALSQWLMPNDFILKNDQEFKFKTEPRPGFDGIVHCKIIDIIPLEKLSFTWSGGSLRNTIVSFNLIKRGNKTLLKFSHTGFEGLLNRLIARNILAAGWKRTILTKQLNKYLSNV